MATLEKIRSKSVLLFCIIIIALLAFIMGDFLTSGRSYFGHGDTVAEVNGKKIKYDNYRQFEQNLSQQRQDEYNRQAEARGQQAMKVDNDEIAIEAINNLALQALVEDQYDKLGIHVTDKEISEAMHGEHPRGLEFLTYAPQAFGIPASDPKTAANSMLDIINNPSRYPGQNSQMLAQYWAQYEDVIEQEIKSGAFTTLLSGLFTANKLDAQTQYDNNMTRARVQYVAVPASKVTDEEVSVADADIKAQYDKDKAQFKLDEETRMVDYIAIELTPSREDYNAAEVLVDQLVENLRAEEGVPATVYSTGFDFETITIPVDSKNSNMKLRWMPDSAMTANNVYKFPLRRDEFAVAKVLSIEPEFDEVTITALAVANSEEGDSIMKEIRGGKSFAEFDPSEETFNLVTNEDHRKGLLPALKNSITTAETGKVYLFEDSTMGYRGMIVRVDNRPAPVKVANVFHAQYKVAPSQTTINNERTKLNGFLASNSKADKFSANADSLYRLYRSVPVTKNSAHIGNIPNSRLAVKWAMDAKKGQVSRVFEDNKDYLLVVALKDIYNDYVPYTDNSVNDYLAMQAMQAKKAQKLVADYAGKANDLAGYAELMDATVQVDSTIVVTRGRHGNEFQGKVFSAAPGTMFGPIEGNGEAIVFVVDGTQTVGRPQDFTQDGNDFMFTYFRNLRNQNLLPLLLGDGKIKNYQLDFYQDPNAK